MHSYGCGANLEVGSSSSATEMASNKTLSADTSKCTSLTLPFEPRLLVKATDILVESENPFDHEDDASKPARTDFSLPHNYKKLQKALAFMEEMDKNFETNGLRMAVTLLKDGKTPYYMSNAEDVGRLLGISASSIRKAMPVNILKYHKKASNCSTDYLVCHPISIPWYCVYIQINIKVCADITGTQHVKFGLGQSCELGEQGEQELVSWIIELCERGWPPEWFDIHAAARSIAKAQGTV